MRSSSLTAPQAYLWRADITAECSSHPDMFVSGRPIRVEYIILANAVYLYQAHRFLTQIMEIFMDSAICRFVRSHFLFSRIIHRVFDSSSLPMATLGHPLLHRNTHTLTSLRFCCQNFIQILRRYTIFLDTT